MNVVITGASKGFGKAIAAAFAEQGNDLFLCSRNEQALNSAVAELQQDYPGIRIQARPFDLSVKAQAIAFGEWILAQAVSVDVLVNNAGLFEPGGVHNEADGVLEQMIQVNLYSAYHLTRTLLPAMMEQQAGHIFNICSIASLQAYPNGGAYSISKFALAGFSRNLREEMKPHGIKVTGVFPGAAYTNSWAGTGVDPLRIMEAKDIATMICAAVQLSPQACVEDIVLRPQLGDL
ncbi:MAG: SDR family oxidoreductase [Candidatus Pseudobacter hemicellulosilyticus]|uniref:SDR family oxidoreductase n=1 Tax=Candidatus Pseudobacter hemicellulosilyticus TaxID=3121375 RepID=A0AAJ5WR60_9BACT|nr:MAG: SDR family oxidoreductase [Pseudobacter sp.]